MNDLNDLIGFLAWLPWYAWPILIAFVGAGAGLCFSAKFKSRRE
jgi:hypothetical protein